MSRGSARERLLRSRLEPERVRAPRYPREEEEEEEAWQVRAVSEAAPPQPCGGMAGCVLCVLPAWGEPAPCPRMEPGRTLAVDSGAGLRVLLVCCAGKEGAAGLPSLSARETWAGQWG